MPGMKESTELVVVPIGMRTGAVQVVPSVDVLMTMSFSAQPERKRQSDQTTYTFPAASISAEGSVGERMPPASLWFEIVAIVAAFVQVTPPSDETRERTCVSDELSIGMITLPLGCTTGWPPMTPRFGTEPCVH